MMLPEQPGVYRFMNIEQRVIYVGKSKNLKHRVRSYFTGAKEGKIARLVHQIHDLEYELCDTHLEARLLECQRIKELRPVFNKQLKRERGFVYLRIGQTPRQEPLTVAYHPADGIGPFRNRRLLESVIESFARLYPMRLAGSADETGVLPKRGNEGDHGPKGQRVAFEYSILPQRIATETYLQNQKALRSLFDREDLWQRFFEDLSEAMMQAADDQKFQEAIFYRDFIRNLSLLQRMWFEDRKLFHEILFLKLPMQTGEKYFRVRSGLIEASAAAPSSDAQAFSRFMENEPAGVSNPWEEFSELEQYDFRDILYSEIRSLPPEQIIRAEDSQCQE